MVLYTLMSKIIEREQAASLSALSVAVRHVGPVRDYWFGKQDAVPQLRYPRWRRLPENVAWSHVPEGESAHDNHWTILSGERPPSHWSLWGKLQAARPANWHYIAVLGVPRTILQEAMDQAGPNARPYLTYKLGESAMGAAIPNPDTTDEQLSGVIMPNTADLANPLVGGAERIGWDAPLKAAMAAVDLRAQRTILISRAVTFSAVVTSPDLLPELHPDVVLF
jgi:hypothetical protein